MTRAGASVDIGRLLDTNDVAYRMALLAMNHRLAELSRRDNEKAADG